MQSNVKSKQENGHSVDVCFNNGWEEDPSWKIICECSWETWDHSSESSARRSYGLHVAGVGHS